MIDWQVLDKRFKGKQAFIRSLGQSTLDSHAESPDKLRHLAETKDFTALAFLAHSLKGLGGNLAATAVQELAARTEQAAREQDEQAFFLALRLADGFVLFLDEIETFVNQE
jgi:HPt (histidine-containing phosphotransfer) domain-containing protein